MSLINSNLDPIDLAISFSALQLNPMLQSNAYTLEYLVNVSLANGILGMPNNKKANKKEVISIFNEVQAMNISRLQDPAEDVMVNLVYYEKNNYRILEGLWQDNTFFLQKFLNVVAGMPLTAEFFVLRNSVLSLLKISEETCARAKLKKYLVGQDVPIKSLKNSDLSNFEKLKSYIKFSSIDLVNLKINESDLENFVFDINKRKSLLNSSPSSSELSINPIIKYKDDYFVIAPSAIGIAIRVMIIRFCYERNGIDTLQFKIAEEYRNDFIENTKLGKPFDYDQLQTFVCKDSGIKYASCCLYSKVGLYFHVLLIFDDFSNFNKGKSQHNPSIIGHAIT